MDRVLRSVASPIAVTIRDRDGEPVDATGPVAYAVKDSAGTAIQSGTATHGGSGTGRYEFVLIPANAGVLDVYTVTWTGTVDGYANTYTTQFEIIGAFLFGIAELRALKAELADEVKYPAADIIAAREVAEEILETACDVAFRPLGARELADGSGHATLLLARKRPIRIVSASMSYGNGFTDLTAEQLADLRPKPSGEVEWWPGGTWTRGHQNVKVHYEHGYTQPPEPIRRASMLLAQEWLLESNVPARATSESSDVGVIRYTVAGRDGVTGIPEVDSAIKQFDHSDPL